MANKFERKKRSEDFLREHGIYVDEALPPLEVPEKIISKEDMFFRGINAFYTGLSAVVILRDINEMDQAGRLVGTLEQLGLSDAATEKELNFHEYITGSIKGLSGDAEDFAALLRRNRSLVTRQEVSCMSWRVERALPLLWACGMIDKDLPYPSEASDYHYVVDCFWNLYDRMGDPSLPEGVLPLTERSIEEIMDQADLVYRMEHACKKARRENDTTRIDTRYINDLKHRVPYEWNWGFQWLLGRVDDWDNDDIERDGV